jgi:hypothetical protein
MPVRRRSGSPERGFGAPPHDDMPVVIEHRHLDPTPPGVDQLVQTSGADSAASVEPPGVRCTTPVNEAHQ